MGITALFVLIVTVGSSCLAEQPPTRSFAPSTDTTPAQVTQEELQARAVARILLLRQELGHSGKKSNNTQTPATVQQAFDACTAGLISDTKEAQALVPHCHDAQEKAAALRDLIAHLAHIRDTYANDITQVLALLDELLTTDVCEPVLAQARTVVDQEGNMGSDYTPGDPSDLISGMFGSPQRDGLSAEEQRAIVASYQSQLKKTQAAVSGSRMIAITICSVGAVAALSVGGGYAFYLTCL